MTRYQTIGTNFKSFTCSQTGEEITRRKSLAIDHKGDGKVIGKTSRGRTITHASPCKRIKRELAPKPVILSVGPNVDYIRKVQEKMGVKSEERLKIKVSPKIVKSLSTKEKVQMKKLLQKKRNEIKKST